METEEQFVAAAEAELKALLQALDSIGDDVEVELAGDILTIDFDDDTQFVINRHSAARQIWMAAERTAWHFDRDAAAGAWIATKSGDELWSALSRTLTRKLGRSIRLSHS